MQDSVNKIYPWLGSYWHQIFAEDARLHHALLIAGQSGLGKASLAEAIAAKLLCEKSGTASLDTACGECQSCRWLAAGNHPDFRRLAPESDDEPAAEETTTKAAAKKKPSTVIKIDQVRGLEDFVYVGSHRRGKRVILINPAEAMNQAATNSLLKILEEPPSSVYFILVSSAWRRLLPTVLSRCRTLLIGRPEAATAVDWLEAQGVGDAGRLLQVTGGAPLTAAAWAEQGRLRSYEANLEVLTRPQEGLLAMAGKWDSQLRANPDGGLEMLVETIQKWLVDLIQMKLAGAPRFHLAWNDLLDRLAKPANLGRLIACYNELIGIRAVANHPLNTQLFLEDLAARYLRALRP